MVYNHKLLWLLSVCVWRFSKCEQQDFNLAAEIVKCKTPHQDPQKKNQIKAAIFENCFNFSFHVWFRTSTSACPCLLISEFLTVTWRSCSSAAPPSTSHSAVAPAEPRWSVSAHLCVCYFFIALRRCCYVPSVQVTMATGPVWDQDRLGSHLTHQIGSHLDHASLCKLLITRRLMLVGSLSNVTPELKKVGTSSKYSIFCSCSHFWSEICHVHKIFLAATVENDQRKYFLDVNTDTVGPSTDRRNSYILAPCWISSYSSLMTLYALQYRLS